MQRKSIIFLMSILVIGFCSVVLTGRDALALDHDFAGVKKCMMCHKKADMGNQAGAWKNGPHAKAFETLGTPEAKAAAAEMGIDDPQTSGKCLKCHATSHYFTEASVTAKVKDSEGVTCESCHGPGKDYMKMSVMKDHDKAIAAGLLMDGEGTCVKCHNEESPTYKPFNFAERWEEVKHPKP